MKKTAIKMMFLVFFFNGCHHHDEVLINNTKMEMRGILSLLQDLDAKQIAYLKDNTNQLDGKLPVAAILAALKPTVPARIESLEWLADGDGWGVAYRFCFQSANLPGTFQIKISSSGPDGEWLTKDDISREVLFSPP